MTKFMQIAIEEAKLAAARDEVPVGAVIVCNNEIIARAGNKTEELANPTAHAEMLVIQEACKKLGNARIPDCDLYVTLEPCPMCFAAISFARIRRVYFGVADPKSGGEFLLGQRQIHHKPEVYNGIAENECAELIKAFFAGKRRQ